MPLQLVPHGSGRLDQFQFSAFILISDLVVISASDDYTGGRLGSLVMAQLRDNRTVIRVVRSSPFFFFCLTTHRCGRKMTESSASAHPKVNGTGLRHGSI